MSSAKRDQFSWSELSRVRRRRNCQLRVELLFSVGELDRAITDFDDAEDKRNRGIRRLQFDVVAFGHSFAVDNRQPRMTQRNRRDPDHVGAKLDYDWRRRLIRARGADAVRARFDEGGKTQSVARFKSMPPKNECGR